MGARLAGGWRLVMGVVVGLVFSGVAQARDAGDLSLGAESPPTLEHLLEAPDEPEVYAGLDIVSSYVSRGMVFSNKVSAQPWIEAHFPAPLFREVAGVGQPRLIVGNWNSFQSGGPGLGQSRSGPLASWYEADLYAGLGLTFVENLWTELRYNYYTSPADSFGDVHELDFRLSYNDASFWEREAGVEGFAVYPAVRLTREISTPSGMRRSTYLQTSVTPTFTYEELPFEPTVELPLVAGFGWGDQFVDGDGDSRTFGYVRSGIHLSAPLDFLDEAYGRLRLRTGLDVYVASDRGITGRGRRTLLVGNVGVRYSF